MQYLSTLYFLIKKKLS